MALPVWQATVTDDTGDVLPGAQIDVVIESTGTDATLFSNRAGTTSLSNPFFADSEGFAQFYTDAGAYRITATASGGGTTRTWRYVSLFDFDANVGTSAGEVPLNSDLGSASLVDAIGSGDLYGRDSILGTVSETAGVPTGAVIERGGNSDGLYTKYADGTINCWDLDFSLDTFITPDIRNTWTFPEEFIYTPTCFGAMTRSVASSTSLDDGDISYLRLANVSSTDVVVLLEPASGSTFSSGDSIVVNVMAQGRWF